jgi:hypothetical protein
LDRNKVCGDVRDTHQLHLAEDHPHLMSQISMVVLIGKELRRQSPEQIGEEGKTAELCPMQSVPRCMERGRQYFRGALRRRRLCSANFPSRVLLLDGSVNIACQLYRDADIALFCVRGVKLTYQVRVCRRLPIWPYNQTRVLQMQVSRHITPIFRK